LGSWLGGLGWVGQLAQMFALGWAVGSPVWGGLGGRLGSCGWLARVRGCVCWFAHGGGLGEDAGVKGSGSMWFGYGVVVLVTFGVGLLAFAVWVLSKVF
jgi:hypothetical protein